MADPNSAAFGAIVGICTALVICVVALIIFVVVFCNLKIKNDNNIRKRVVAKDAFDEVRTVEEARPVIQPPAPVLVTPQLTPVPPRPVPIPRIPTPPSPIAARARTPQPRPSHVRSRSWGAAENDWLLVKKITKRRRRSSGSSSSSDSSCDGGHHHDHHHDCRRLAPYDLATPMMMPRPATTTVTPFLVQPFMA